MNKVTVIPGIAMPFFPMRPLTGPKLVKEADVENLTPSGYFWQPKLNGDRVILGKFEGKVYISNRHGGWYSHTVKNLGLWARVPDQTVLDGEVWQMKFLPFEALAVGGVSLLRECVTKRAAKAKELAISLEEPFLFDSPTVEWLKTNLRNKPKEWEGVVGKKKDAPYLILGSEKDSPGWVKRKWCI